MQSLRVRQHYGASCLSQTATGKLLALILAIHKNTVYARGKSHPPRRAQRAGCCARRKSAKLAIPSPKTKRTRQCHGKGKSPYTAEHSYRTRMPPRGRPQKRQAGGAGAAHLPQRLQSPARGGPWLQPGRDAQAEAGGPKAPEGTARTRSGSTQRCTKSAAGGDLKNELTGRSRVGYPTRLN